MERITTRDLEGCPFLAHDPGWLGVLERLAAYEDAEEQGLLVKMPCKNGTPIWRVWNGEIRRHWVVSVNAQHHTKLRFLVECVPFLRFYWDDLIGTQVFLARKEAEEALKKEKM